ncbi:MAG: polysaccharide biosynthesis/export family protein [Synechococcales bacterium]|nr:polysaccharide biosynthesis/export family protein [Synechococcales bacterium]
MILYCQTLQPLKAWSLLSLYSLSTALASSLLWGLAARATAPPAATLPSAATEVAQTIDVIPPPAASPAPELSPLDQLYDAQQQLRDRMPSPFAPAVDPANSLDAEFDRYRLGPGDSIFVNVQGFPEANFQATLDLQGNILVPLAGIVPLQGLTLDQAQELIHAQLNRFYVNPVIDLTLVVQRPVQVTILGEVVRPGLYPLQLANLPAALITAGGTTRLANLKSVQVRRVLRDRTGAVVDVIEESVDLFSPLAEGQSLPTTRLADGDVIIVPTLTAEEIEAYDRTLVARSTLGQPTMNIRVLSYPTRIGNLTLPSGSDFLDAITVISPEQASSDLRHIALIRYDPATGRAIKLELDAKDAFMGDTSQNVVLEDNDVIVIGRSLIARITFTLNTFTQPFRDVLGFVLFFDTIRSSVETLFRPDSSEDDSDN